MKYFSLSFRLQKEDYSAYYKDFRKGHILNELKRSVFMAIFSVFVLVSVVTAETPSYIIPVISVFAVSVFLPIYFSRKVSTSFYNSKQGSKEARYDFFADHIEIHIGSTESCRQTSEKHLKMRGFTQIIESRSNFYFSYMNEKMLIIPKRILNEETYSMIKNMIENYFSKVYLSI